MRIPELCPIDKACKILGVSRMTLYRLAEDGQLEKTEPTTTSPRRRVYVTGESIRRYLARHRAEHGKRTTAGTR